MKIINKVRGAGKTTEAIKVANETGAYLVVHSDGEAKRIADNCNRFPITYQELVNPSGRNYGSKVVIDNINIFLSWLIRDKVIAFTITSEESE